ncbi:MAG TPA: hypothetical protein VN158_02015, partial [Caulobacter sp.]|nr:hypothetical protein [Caulobacter sp.]
GSGLKARTDIRRSTAFETVSNALFEDSGIKASLRDAPLCPATDSGGLVSIRPQGQGKRKTSGERLGGDL